MPLFHNSVEFAFCIKGESDVWIDGKTYTMQENEVLFMNSFEPHAYYYKKGTECYIVLISAGFFNKNNNLANISFPTHMEKNENFHKIREYLDYMYAQWEGDSLSLKISFSEMLIWLMKKYYPTCPKKKLEEEKELSSEIIKYICEHFDEDVNVGILSKKFGYSPNYFSSIFNRFMGMSFREYLNAYRIMEYKKLRRNNPGNSVSASAALCGFGSMNSFYRAYKRYSPYICE